MPTVYLSPSAQEYNPYITGGNEEYYMNLIVDEMIPYLDASGIRWYRNDRNRNVTQIIDDSNAKGPDLHFALHSNAAPEDLAGLLRGPQVFYYPTSSKGRRAAEITASNLKVIYPSPSLVRVIPSTDLSELERTKAPSVYVELAYHDNLADANWITQNIPIIARTLALSIAEYFNVPFLTEPGETPSFPRVGEVRTESGNLNIRNEPSATAPVIARAANGSVLEVLGEAGDGWYEVTVAPDRTGFADARFIRLQ